MEFNCPHCGQAFTPSMGEYGILIHCPSCGGDIMMPSLEEAEESIAAEDRVHVSPIDKNAPLDTWMRVCSLLCPLIWVVAMWIGYASKGEWRKAKEIWVWYAYGFTGRIVLLFAYIEVSSLMHK